MPYVSAQYAPPLADPLMEPKAGDPRRVIAVDDQGVEWHLTEDSQVGDWLRFKAAGGTVREPPQVDPAKAKKGKSHG
jgi:hypothetical protein